MTPDTVPAEAVFLPDRAIELATMAVRAKTREARLALRDDSDRVFTEIAYEALAAAAPLIVADRDVTIERLKAANANLIRHAEAFADDRIHDTAEIARLTAERDAALARIEIVLNACNQAEASGVDRIHVDGIRRDLADAGDSGGGQ